MVRRSNALRLRPVNSLKHIVDIVTSTVTAVVTTAPVIIAVDSPTLSNPEQVHQGSTVSAIFLSVEVFATNAFAGVPNIYMYVIKNPGNNLTNPSPSGTGIFDEKRYIIHQEMTMVGNGALGSFPRTMFKGVIRIPPRLKRFGYKDRLNVVLQHTAGETSGITNVCVQAIYKEFQ